MIRYVPYHEIPYVAYLDFVFIQCLPEKRAVTLFAELLAALSYLHSIGILKRDFKNNFIIADSFRLKLSLDLDEFLNNKNGKF